MLEDTGSTHAVELATELTIAWLANPNTDASSDDLTAFLQKMHRAVIGLTPAPIEQPVGEPEYTPAVTVRRSLSSKDHIISLIDGKPYKTLRRHLARHGLTPQRYRERYNLKPDYPMVSESYSLVRRDMAKKIGLGHNPGSKLATKVAATTPKPAAKPRGRPRTVSA
jgi:predicted transcriptional regulator